MSFNINNLILCRILNNDAVSCYQTCEYDEAHQKLTAALELVIATLSNAECQENTTRALFNENHRININNQISSDKIGFYARRPKHRGTGIEHSEPMYDAGFIFSDDIPVEVQDTAIVLLFNTALMRHKIGMHSKKLSYFHSAHHLYNKCLSLFSGTCDGENEEGMSFSISLMIIKAAACVNMLHLFQYGINTVTMDPPRNIVSYFHCAMIQLHSHPKTWLFMSKPDQHFFSVELFMTMNSPMNIRSAQAA